MKIQIIMVFFIIELPIATELKELSTFCALFAFHFMDSETM